MKLQIEFEHGPSMHLTQCNHTAYKDQGGTLYVFDATYTEVMIVADKIYQTRKFALTWHEPCINV